MKRHYQFLIILSLGLSLYTSLFAHMNNWLIFRASFWHLWEGNSLYILYPGEHQDLFKYSPTFALFMAPLSVLPAWLGACLWNLLGVCLLIVSLQELPMTDQDRKGIFWVSLPEFIGSTQGFQSNIHMVALLVLFWTHLERGHFFRSSLSLFSSFLIKIFGILGLCLLAFQWRPNNPFRVAWGLISRSLVLGIVLGPLPALFIGFESLEFQYSEWLRLLKADAAQSYGFSLMGIIHGFTSWSFDRLPIQVGGGLCLLVSFLCFRQSGQTGRLLGLVSLCYFMVLFNHKSESPTFIIAMVGFGIHQSLIKNQKLRWSLIVITLGCVSLMYSDLFRHIKQSHLDVYSVKAWPFVILFPLAILQINVRKLQKNLTPNI